MNARILIHCNVYESDTLDLSASKLQFESSGRGGRS